MSEPERSAAAPSLAERKREARRAARDARDRHPDRDAASAAACRHVIALPAYRAARTVLWYVSMPGELATRDALAAELRAAKTDGRRIAIPWCDGDDLSLWRLDSLDELEPGTWGILEPPPARRGDAARRVAPAELDFVVTPGLAFDRNGRRLGYGRGYYDRLLARAPDATRVGLCLSTQIIDEVPAGARDMPMHWVVTEEGAHPVPA